MSYNYPSPEEISKRLLGKDKKLEKQLLGKSITFGISQEGRIRIPAKRKHDVEKKYHHKCAVSSCKIKLGGAIKLQFHHKNMKSNDNRLTNLELLCPNHHILRHSKKFRKVISKDLYGNKVKRLVNKKSNSSNKKSNKNNPFGFGDVKFPNIKTNNEGYNWFS